MRLLWGLMVGCLLWGAPGAWAAPSAPSEVRLTADQLRFDPATERAYADAYARYLAAFDAVEKALA